MKKKKMQVIFKSIKYSKSFKRLIDTKKNNLILHSVFDHSFNFNCVSDGRGEEEMRSWLDPFYFKNLFNVNVKEGLSPNGVKIIKDSEKSFKELGLERGMTLFIIKNEKEIEKIENYKSTNRRIFLKVNGGDEWDPVIRPIRFKNEFLMERISFLVKLSQKIMEEKENYQVGFSFLLNRIKFKENCFVVEIDKNEKVPLLCIPVLKFLESLERNNSIESCTKNIVGLGDGSTPSGDDFIVGFFASLKKFNISLIATNPNFEKELIKDIVLNDLTTHLSQSFYLSCTRGEYSEIVHILFDLLFKEMLFEEKDSISEEKLRWILNFGASSGLDLFLGVLFGINHCIKIK